MKPVMKPYRAVLFLFLALAMWAQLSFRAYGADFLLYGTTGKNASNPGALYLIDPDTGQSTLIGSTGFNEVSGIAFAPDGTLYGVTGGSIGPAYLITIDVNTGASTLVGPVGLSGLGVGAIDFAPDGTLFGIAWSPSQLITIDVNTGAATFVADLTGSSGNNWTPGLSFSPEGVLYGSRGGSSGHTEDLVIVDTSTGVLTAIGTSTRNITDLAFAPDGTLYGADSSGVLVMIDPATGAKTVVGSVGFSSFSGLAAFPPAVFPNLAADIPTLTEWGMILLTVIIALSGIWMIRRRARTRSYSSAMT
jgi:Tol biopolymer transport system component